MIAICEYRVIPTNFDWPGSNLTDYCNNGIIYSVASESNKSINKRYNALVFRKLHLPPSDAGESTLSEFKDFIKMPVLKLCCENHSIYKVWKTTVRECRKRRKELDKEIKGLEKDIKNLKHFLNPQREQVHFEDIETLREGFQLDKVALESTKWFIGNFSKGNLMYTKRFYNFFYKRTKIPSY